MTPGARTPEELETLLEDAFVTRDREALADLFGDGAVLAAGGRHARGAEEIARLASAIWESDRTYVAEPQRVLQARDTALVVAERAINVVRRGPDGGWRYAIARLELDHPTDEGGAVTEQTVQAGALRPIAVRADEGEARWWFGSLAVIKATAAETGGQLTIVEVTEPPGAEAPLHVHHRDDEGFWILEGDATFEVGDATIAASESDYVFGPRGIPHRFTVGERGCRMLFIMVPGGLEHVLRQTSEPAGSRTVPPPSGEEPTPEEMEQLKAIVKEHGYELLV